MPQPLIDHTRLHELKSVYTDFKIISNLIQSGYRFDDKDAPSLIQQLEKALQMFKTEIDFLAGKSP
jgi:hypothetical protein